VQKFREHSEFLHNLLHVITSFAKNTPAPKHKRRLHKLAFTHLSPPVSSHTLFFGSKNANELSATMREVFGANEPNFDEISKDR
jgi:hypothetical protein